jgi:hypothetical protein
MGTKTRAPVQWVRSILMAGSMVVLVGSTGCCFPPKRPRPPQQPSVPFQGSSAAATGSGNTVQPYRNLPQDPDSRWGQTSQGGPGSSNPAGQTPSNAAAATLGSTNTGASQANQQVYNVPGSSQNRGLASDATRFGQAPDPTPPNTQTARFGSPAPTPLPVDPRAGAEETVQPLPPSQVGMGPLDGPSGQQTGMSRPSLIPPPPSETGITPVSYNTPAPLPRFGSAPPDQQAPSDPVLAAPPPKVNNYPTPLPPLPAN